MSKEVEKVLEDIIQKEKEKRDMITIPSGDITRFEEVEDYLLSVVSGKSYDKEMNLGRAIVSFKTLKQMVDNGYDIKNALCLRVDENTLDGSNDLIEVEYNKLIRRNEIGKRR